MQTGRTGVSIKRIKLLAATSVMALAAGSLAVLWRTPQ
jgi:hypothetical protein